MPPLMAFGRGHTMLPLSNAFEAATGAYHHLANGTDNGTDTDRRTNCSIVLCPKPVGRSITRHSAIAEGLFDVLCQLKSCQLLHNVRTITVKMAYNE